MKPPSWRRELQPQDDTGKILLHVSEILFTLCPGTVVEQFPPVVHGAVQCCIGLEFVSERFFSLWSAGCSAILIV
jgi:xanthine/uracil permease